MHITSLSLRDIRIIKSCDLQLNKGVTVFIGDNGQGKTSILESIHLASHMKSFRHVSNQDVISKNSESARILVDITDDERPQDISVYLERNSRDYVLVNGQKLRKISDLLGTIRVTVFTPDDLDIVKGTSSLRREVIDDALCQIGKKFVVVSKDYARALKQKNAYLKSDEHNSSVLEVLNSSIVTSGSQVIRARLNALSSFRELLQDAYNHISGENSKISVTYISKIFGNDHGEDVLIDEGADIEKISNVFNDAIVKYSDIENIRRHGIIGPHRDDLAIAIHSRDSRTQASQGEQRSLALALKIALHSFVTTSTGDNPILLLDDVFSELDIGRTHRLVECLPATQTFVTTATDIPSTLKVGETFSVNSGIISPLQS